MHYHEQAREELTLWKDRMQRPPTFFNRLARGMQGKVNSVIPEKVHAAITTAIKQMTRAVCFGMKFATPDPLADRTLHEREAKVDDRIKFYSRTAAAEGAVTGAGGLLLGLADFPLWLTLKMKMLFEIAALYGFDVKDYRERIFLLHIFELTFSSQAHRRRVFSILSDWPNYSQQLPNDIHQFDWRSFQQEYRDFIDLAKLLQLIPGIGAPIGAVVNLRLTKKLGAMAKNAYRMRLGI
jgi:hypothetical protein